MRKRNYLIAASFLALTGAAALLFRQQAAAQILVPVQRGENGLVPVSPQFVEMKLDNKTSILVETLDAIPVSIKNRVDAPGQAAGREYQSLIENLKPLVSGIVDSVKAGSVEPDEINVEFGVAVSAATGIPKLALVNMSGQMSLKVSVTWRKAKK